jgi:hypothetical protein
MKAVCVIKCEGYREFIERDSVQEALKDGQQAALALATKGRQNVRLAVYEMVAQAPVVSTHVIHIEKVTKP